MILRGGESGGVEACDSGFDRGRRRRRRDNGGGGGIGVAGTGRMSNVNGVFAKTGNKVSHFRERSEEFEERRKKSVCFLGI